MARWALFVVDADGPPRKTIEGNMGGMVGSSDPPRSAAFSPDGTRVALAVRGGPAFGFRVGSYDVAMEREEELSAPTFSLVRALVWPRPGEILVATEEANSDIGRLWSVALPGDVVRRVSSDASTYVSLSATRDGRTLAGVRSVRRGDVWTVRKAGKAEHVAAGMARVAYAPNGDLAYISNEGGTFSLYRRSAADGMVHRLGKVPTLPGIPGTGALKTFTVCGESTFVIPMDSERGISLWRFDATGERGVPLTPGPIDVFPDSSRDGKWVHFFRFTERGPRLARVALAGGAPEPLGDASFFKPALSPDGRRLAAMTQPTTPVSGLTRIAVLTLEGRETASIDLPPTSRAMEPARWTADGRAIVHADRVGGADNLFVQPLAGGPRRAWTRFESGEIDPFAVSPDGETLAVARHEQRRTSSSCGE
jgi:Tol biopolymer transport system component